MAARYRQPRPGHLVVLLEEKTGLTPFAKGFVLFHTAGELAALFGD
ncbi:MAG: hypothetical protein WDN06_03200 [Asticcacaulis sp.]